MPRMDAPYRAGLMERAGTFLTLRSKLPAWLQALLTFAYITGWRIRSVQEVTGKVAAKSPVFLASPNL